MLRFSADAGSSSAATNRHVHPSLHAWLSNLQFSCSKCQPAADYTVRLSIKAGSQKNLMHLEYTGYEVLSLKGAHYHNKEQTISLIKQACLSPHTATCHAAGNLHSLSWTLQKKPPRQLMSGEEIHSFLLGWGFIMWQLMMDCMSRKKRREMLRGGW